MDKNLNLQKVLKILKKEFGHEHIDAVNWSDSMNITNKKLILDIIREEHYNSLDDFIKALKKSITKNKRDLLDYGYSIVENLYNEGKFDDLIIDVDTIWKLLKNDYVKILPDDEEVEATLKELYLTYDLLVSDEDVFNKIDFNLVEDIENLSVKELVEKYTDTIVERFVNFYGSSLKKFFTTKRSKNLAGKLDEYFYNYFRQYGRNRNDYTAFFVKVNMSCYSYLKILPLLDTAEEKDISIIAKKGTEICFLIDGQEISYVLEDDEKINVSLNYFVEGSMNNSRLFLKSNEEVAKVNILG